MVDDRDLEGLDPYELMAAEAARLDRFFGGATDADWTKPTRCDGWSVRDLLAHLAASEDYNRACLDGTVQQFLADMGAKGAVDLASANDIGVHEFDGQHAATRSSTIWRERSTQNREAFRARDGGDVDSSVGAYPARWQAFHLAFELATHADDVGVPVERRRGRGRASMAGPLRPLRDQGAEARAHDRVDAGRTHVKGDGVDIELPDEQFVQAVAARLPEESGIDDDTAITLSATP